MKKEIPASIFQIEVRVTGWINADHTTIELKGFAAMLKPMGFLKTEHAELELLKIFNTIPKRIQAVFLEREFPRL